ncbi:hypothetical protein [Clostridium kluyveri]|uniref:hypothetical protein n=1 Tax=Clostridium kluyveri TaxID=1534 RepID=UPI0018DC0EBC|nr:hypothetical protein [Clostridium kluyveri]
MQEITIQRIKVAKGKAFKVTSLEEVKDILEIWRYMKEQQLRKQQIQENCKWNCSYKNHISRK